MENLRQRMEELDSKLNSIILKNNEYFSEINEVKSEFQKLKFIINENIESILENEKTDLIDSSLDNNVIENDVLKNNQVENIIISNIETNEGKESSNNIKVENEKPDTFGKYQQNSPPFSSHQTKFNNSTKKKDFKLNLKTEEFIGGNLANKIGILILVIGACIGGKYSIEQNLISPLTRIILGYFWGFGLILFSYKLKSKYEAFSAVLLSGAMSILYFITFFAFSFYNLISLEIAFILMLIFTVFTVFASLNYNRMIIALLGLVGAYAIPFMLSDGSGKVLFLLSYIAFINIGILFISIKKDWKPLYTIAFAFTWIVFSVSNNILEGKHNFKFSLLFLSIYFLTFFTISNIDKSIKNISILNKNSIPIFLNYLLFNVFIFNYVHSYSTNFITIFIFMFFANFLLSIFNFRNNLKILNIITFISCWLTFSSWYRFHYVFKENFEVSILFITIFFIAFYIMIVAYKVIKNEKFSQNDIFLLMINSFVFYGFGYNLLSSNPLTSNLLGLFTLTNALIHSGVVYYLFQKKEIDPKLFYSIVGIVLIFISIAIPVQFDLNWVTMMWATEAVLLFWIGRKFNVSFYENASNIIIVIALLSMLQDWSNYYNYNPYEISTRVIPIFNLSFYTSIFVISSICFIYLLDKKLPNTNIENKLNSNLKIILPIVIAVFCYIALFLEISVYFNQLNLDSIYTKKPLEFTMNAHYYGNPDIENFKLIWLVNFSVIFSLIITLLNIYKIKNINISIFNIILAFCLFLLLLFSVLPALSNLRYSFQFPVKGDIFIHSNWNIYFRYLVFIIFASLLFGIKKLNKEGYIKDEFKTYFYLTFNFILVYTLSDELFNILNLTHSNENLYKFGLTILWSVYSLIIIVYGIWKKNKALRWGGITLFGVAIVKLIIYDSASLGTISKTILYMSLGVLLLIISFLYNKYKLLLFEPNENTDETE